VEDLKSSLAALAAKMEQAAPGGGAWLDRCKTLPACDACPGLNICKGGRAEIAARSGIRYSALYLHEPPPDDEAQGDGLDEARGSSEPHAAPLLPAEDETAAYYSCTNPETLYLRKTFPPPTRAEVFRQLLAIVREHLTKKQWQVITLCLGEGMTHEEAGKALEPPISGEAVRLRLGAAQGRLQGVLYKTLFFWQSYGQTYDRTNSQKVSPRAFGWPADIALDSWRRSYWGWEYRDPSDRSQGKRDVYRVETADTLDDYLAAAWTGQEPPVVPNGVRGGDVLGPRRRKRKTQEGGRRHLKGVEILPLYRGLRELLEVEMLEQALARAAARKGGALTWREQARVERVIERRANLRFRAHNMETRYAHELTRPWAQEGPPAAHLEGREKGLGRAWLSEARSAHHELTAAARRYSPLVLRQKKRKALLDNVLLGIFLGPPAEDYLRQETHAALAPGPRGRGGDTNAHLGLPSPRLLTTASRAKWGADAINEKNERWWTRRRHAWIDKIAEVDSFHLYKDDEGKWRRREGFARVHFTYGPRRTYGMSIDTFTRKPRPDVLPIDPMVRATVDALMDEFYSLCEDIRRLKEERERAAREKT